MRAGAKRSNPGGDRASAKSPAGGGLVSEREAGRRSYRGRRSSLVCEGGVMTSMTSTIETLRSTSLPFTS